jgi:uncharacterized protein (TIGR00296 family)
LISDGDGAELVRLARRAVETYLSESAVMRPDKDVPDRAGVFVTLNYLTRNKGFPLPEKKLRQSVIEAAIAAATEDPRFPPVDRPELGSIIFEVSVLTPPEQIKCKPADYKKEIRIGRDGLILSWRYGFGLLLPQVPVELKWDVNEYLANICYKAGAPPDVWLDPACKLYRFQAVVFKELEPGGSTVRLEL